MNISSTGDHVMHNSFHEFDLSEKVLQAVSEMGFETPTRIQNAVIPAALKGRDLIGLAQTGTGKTAAFGIPVVEAAAMGNRKDPFAIVLTPTRELAVQVAREIKKIGKQNGIATVAVYGGQPITTQFRALKKGVDVVVGTPGRIIDHIRRKTLLLENVRIVVLDEADEMLNMGFIEDVETILGEVSGKRQTMLFSATMPPGILRLSTKYMNEPETLNANPENPVVGKIDQIFYTVREEDKSKALMRLLDVQDSSRTLIFCQTKKEVDHLTASLRKAGYGAAGIHGDFPQELRDETMKRFRMGDTQIMVATDVAARGLDISDVTHVVNFTLPRDPDTYVHRIGRTGRAGKSGAALTLVTPKESGRIRLIERSTRSIIRKAVLPTKQEVKQARQRGVLEALDSAIRQGSHQMHSGLVQELCQRYSPEVVAAAALGLLTGDMEAEDIAEIQQKPHSGAATSRGGFVKLHFTLGRRHGIKVTDLLKSITQQAKIKGRDIGRIDLYDTHSHVEVPANLAGRVMSSLSHRKLNGRIIRFS